MGAGSIVRRLTDAAALCPSGAQFRPGRTLKRSSSAASVVQMAWAPAVMLNAGPGRLSSETTVFVRVSMRPSCWVVVVPYQSEPWESATASAAPHVDRRGDPVGARVDAVEAGRAGRVVAAGSPHGGVVRGELGAGARGGDRGQDAVGARVDADDHVRDAVDVGPDRAGAGDDPLWSGEVFGADGDDVDHTHRGGVDLGDRRGGFAVVVRDPDEAAEDRDPDRAGAPRGEADRPGHAVAATGRSG